MLLKILINFHKQDLLLFLFEKLKIAKYYKKNRKKDMFLNLSLFGINFKS